MNVSISDERSSLMHNSDYYSKNIFPKDVDGKSD